MSKIVITEKFLDEYTSALDFRQTQTYRETDFKKATQRSQMLNALNRDEIEVSSLATNADHLAQTKYVQGITMDYNQTLTLIQNKFGKSINQALHEMMPKKYTQKNSKLSNYDLAKSMIRFPAIQQNLAFPMKSLYSEAVVKKTKLNFLVLKHKENKNEQTNLRRKIGIAVERKVSEKRMIIDRDLPQFKEINENFYKNYKTQVNNSNLDKTSNLNSQRGKSMNLLQKYNSLWGKTRDMSIRKTILMQEKVPQTPKIFQSHAVLDSARD
jgi:hypothetical protein